jgi:hypothetical protein
MNFLEVASAVETRPCRPVVRDLPRSLRSQGASPEGKIQLQPDIDQPRGERIDQPIVMEERRRNAQALGSLATLGKLIGRM